MRPSVGAIAIFALMCAASAGAMLLRPSVKVAEELPPLALELMVPRRFGDWQEEPTRVAQVVNPQTQELLDRLYTQILARTYRNADGYRIMLSLAYGSDQRGSLQAHKPEVCYPAQGFIVHRNEAGVLATAFGDIAVRRLFTTNGPRAEPVTYWFTVGDTAVLNSTQKRLVELRYGLTGRIPDGMLFRVSSIDPEAQRAFRLQEQFVQQLLQAVPQDARRRLSGLASAG